MALLQRGRFVRQKGHREQTTPAVIAKRTLAQQCLALRRENLTLRQIADRLNVDGSGTLTEERVGSLIREELDRLGRPMAEDLRNAHRDIIDRTVNRLLGIMMRNEKLAAQCAAQVFNGLGREAAMYGTDAPKQVDLKDERPGTIATTTLQDVVAILAEEARAEAAKEG